MRAESSGGHLDFVTWFADEYRQSGETMTHAVARLAAAIGVSEMTVYRARRGTRVDPETARGIVDVSGGRVTLESLLFAPTTAEVAQRKSLQTQRAQRAQRKG